MPMPKQLFGAKPTVLRCSRCGKFVDWEDARLQVICGCRPHLDLPPVLVREAEDRDRRVVNELFARDFGRLRLVAFGEELAARVRWPRSSPSSSSPTSPARLPTVPVGDDFQFVALATDPMWQRSGVGVHLVQEAELHRPRAGAAARAPVDDERQPAGACTSTSGAATASAK